VKWGKVPKPFIEDPVPVATSLVIERVYVVDQVPHPSGIGVGGEIVSNRAALLTLFNS